MSGENTEPGPRQTVDRVRHPNRGEGVVAHRNGPTFFKPDGGVAIPMRITSRGADMKGSFITLADPDHGGVEVRTLARGDMHHRVWSPLLGAGWLVAVGGAPAGEERFEGDDGRVMLLSVATYSAGTPEYAAKTPWGATKIPELTEEENHWHTLILRDGTVMGFRRDGPPPAAPTARQLALDGAEQQRSAPPKAKKARGSRR